MAMGAVELTVHVSDIDTAIQSFNVIRLKRSLTGETGVYDLITAGVPASAELLASVISPYNVNGKTLTVTLDSEDPVDVTFVGTDPISVDDVAIAINTVLGVSIASDATGI